MGRSKRNKTSDEKSNRTYQYQVLLGASFQRLADAKALLKAERWNGAIYIGCYAIECILKCYLCRLDRNKMNFTDTRFYEQFSGTKGHNITGMFKAADLLLIGNNFDSGMSRNLRIWQQRIVQLGDHTLYRYNEDEGYAKQAKKVLEAVEGWHDEIRWNRLRER